jgi:uncharacterized RDD family membrane protein YckC
METFYVTNQGQRVGPLTQEEVRAKYQRGELALTESYWSEGMAGWMPLHLLVTPGVAAAEPKYGGFWIRVGATLIDGLVIGAPLMFFQRVFMPVQPLQMPPRGADPRVIELALNDYLVKMIPVMLVSFALNLVVYWLYSAIMQSSSRQATLGKIVVGLKVTDLDGHRISFGKATARYLAMNFVSSILTCCIGFLFCAWTEKKQCLHDLMVGTLVVRQD